MTYSFIYICILFVGYCLVKYFSQHYAIDNPGFRKNHQVPISQIGGLFFGIFFLLAPFIENSMPLWFTMGIAISFVTGILDDYLKLNWKIKLMLQMIALLFVVNNFWGEIENIKFYNHFLNLSNELMFLVYGIWFFGIFNAVNLIDGLDGLASGFIHFVCLTLIIVFGFDNNFFTLLFIINAIYLLFNQRPAKVFMGDSGSLVLGYFVAVLPLLIFQNSNIIDMTPFIIISSFLIADTIRVFLTRVINGKNPMDADTFHFHHLIIQQSGSYLVTLMMIFLLVAISSFFTITYSINEYGSRGMLFHLSFLFFFILTPPIPTYVNAISRLVKPTYKWNKSKKIKKPLVKEFILPVLFYLLLLLSLILDINFTLYNILTFLSFLFLVYLVYQKKDKIFFLYSLQLLVTIFVAENFLDANFELYEKLLTIVAFITMFIYTIQKRNGTEIYNYSALDIIIFLTSLILIMLGFTKDIINPWSILIILVLWFLQSFSFRNIFYRGK